MSAQDALEVIDAKIQSLREGPVVIVGNESLIGILTIVRNRLTSGPGSSDAESRLRAAVRRAEGDAIATHLQSELAAALYDGVIAELEEKVERARRVAVALEQENAELIIGGGRRAL